MRRASRWLGLSGIGIALALCAGCLVAAAGAGAGGAVYYTERGTESTLAAPVPQAYSAAQEAFKELGISETKTGTEQESGKEKRTLEGTEGDREVTVTITTEGTGSKVAVVARKSAVTWDKDFAKAILEKIVSKAS